MIDLLDNLFSLIHESFDNIVRLHGPHSTRGSFEADDLSICFFFLHWNYAVTFFCQPNSSRMSTFYKCL